MTGDREYSEREWLEGLRPEDRDPGPEQHAATVRHALQVATWGDLRDGSLAALDELVALASDHAADEREYEKQREYADEQYRKALAAEARADELQRQRDEAREDARVRYAERERTAQDLRQARREADQLRADRHEAWEALEDILVTEVDSFTTASQIARRGLARKRATLAGVQADNKDSA